MADNSSSTDDDETTSDVIPVSEKLVGLTARLDELLLELGQLKDYMPDDDDVANLGKPHKTVKLKPTKAEDQVITQKIKPMAARQSDA